MEIEISKESKEKLKELQQLQKDKSREVLQEKAQKIRVEAMKGFPEMCREYHKHDGRII